MRRWYLSYTQMMKPVSAPALSPSFLILRTAVSCMERCPHLPGTSVFVVVSSCVAPQLSCFLSHLFDSCALLVHVYCWCCPVLPSLTLFLLVAFLASFPSLALNTSFLQGHVHNSLAFSTTTYANRPVTSALCLVILSATLGL